MNTRKIPAPFLPARLALAVLLGFVLPAAAWAREAHLLILHTNDLHDHMRPGAYDQGGLPYVAGYISQVRAGRKDVLVLDAGDVTEKGDMVAAKTGHNMTYEAMRRIGYDAVTIGNHDDDQGIAGLHAFEQVLGRPLVCLNLVKADGSPEFMPSRIVEVAGVKVGIIGLIVPRNYGLDFEASGQALAREAERLRPQVDLLVALCHEGSKDCAQWSRMAPAVDIFVSGHTHELLTAPVIVPGTGAYIVQAGDYARWVGRLEVTVDLERKKVIAAKGEVIPMKHDTVKPDAEMLAWVRQREKELCPEAAEIVMQNSEFVNMEQAAWLGAEALRREAKTDIGFCHAGQIIRSPIFAGPVDVNALYLAGGDRGAATVRTELTGAEITAYLNGLAPDKYDLTNWSGFKATWRRSGAKAGVMETDLVPEKSYSVVMPALEWETRFLRTVKKAVEKKTGGPLAARTFSSQPATVSFTGAMRLYVPQVEAAKESLNGRAEKLAARYFDGPAARSPELGGRQPGT